MSERVFIYLALLMFAILIALGRPVNAQTFDWYHLINGTTMDLVADSEGNVVIVGPHEDGHGHVDGIFIAKFSPGGILLWGRICKFGLAPMARSVTVDNFDDIYVAGDWNQVLENGTMIWYGFLIKLDSNGNLIWDKMLRGTSIVGVVTDPLGKIFVTGDPFIAKFESDGSLIWAKRIGGGLILEKVASDNLGNVYVGGYRFPGSDVFIGKLDSGGNLLWGIIWGVQNPITPKILLWIT